MYLRDCCSTEVGGFGITLADDLMYVEDICLVQQCCTEVSVKFDDIAVADFFENQVAAGRRPEQFARVWLHTHPGDSADPSFVDERTFQLVFGRCDWAVMGILARGGQTYARLRFGVGPGGQMRIPVKVDFHRPFAGSDTVAWQAEFAASVQTWEVKRMQADSLCASSDVPPRDIQFEDYFFDLCAHERTNLAYSEPV